MTEANAHSNKLLVSPEKEKIEEEEKKLLKPLRDKALKKGWATGKHIFHYLDESDYHIYDNIMKEVTIKKALAKSQERIEQLESAYDVLYKQFSNLEFQLAEKDAEIKRLLEVISMSDELIKQARKKNVKNNRTTN